MTGWRFTEASTAMTWSCRMYPRGCWKCRLRKLMRRPRPYRHFNCGPAPVLAMRYLDDAPDA